MPRQRTGSIVERDSKIYARVTYKDERGKRKDLWRIAQTRTEARDIIKKLLRELDDNGSRTLNAARMTFEELADYYSKTYVKPPQYVDGRKVAGMRSMQTRQGHVKTLREYFGKRRLRDMTHGDLERYKAARLAEPIFRKHNPQRSIASVNRELSVLRRMMHIALDEGWITRSPFRRSDAIISIADERTRERIITKSEESRLLAACEYSRRRHLRPIIVCALDTGMRRGEILSLRWHSVDFISSGIEVVEFHTKTLQARRVPMTTRLRSELERLWEASPKDAECLVFGVETNVKRSFASARKAAGLTDVRFHDLRHTAATRLVQGYLPLQEVGRILGHSQTSTTYRYVNANAETVQRAAAIMNAHNAEETFTATELIN